MMAAILNSAILNLAILDSAILIFSFKLTHTCQDWFPPFAQKISFINSDSTWWWQPSWILSCWIQTLPSWIETPCYLLSDSLNNTVTPLWFLTQTNSMWTQIPSVSLNLMKADTLIPDILNLAMLDSAILVFPLKLNHTCQDCFPPLDQKEIHSFILTQLDDGSHLEFCHFGFRHCHLGLRHLVIFSQIHSKTLSLHSDSDSNYLNLTQTHSVSLNLIMAAILNSVILNLDILD